MPDRLRIIVAPDSFKGSCPAARAAQAIADGVRRACPDAIVDCISLADGGEGTTAALLQGRGARIAAEITGPLGAPLHADFGWLPDERTAVIEMAAASGYQLLRDDRRDPLRTTTYGTGQLIRAALDRGASRIIVGVGGSATVDAGCGALQALGVRFLDAHGAPITDPLSGGSLRRIARIDAADLDPRLRETTIDVACDVTNPLCGPDGAAPTFAPQKGARTHTQMRTLIDALDHAAALFARDLGVNVADLPRTGGGGGLPAGLHAALGANLLSGIDLILDAIAFAKRLAGADFILTGEGRLDATTSRGKAIDGVLRAAEPLNIPVVAVVGSVDPTAADLLNHLAAVYPLVRADVTLDEAMRNPESHLAARAAQAMEDFLARPRT